MGVIVSERNVHPVGKGRLCPRGNRDIQAGSVRPENKKHTPWPSAVARRKASITCTLRNDAVSKEPFSTKISIPDRSEITVFAYPVQHIVSQKRARVSESAVPCPCRSRTDYPHRPWYRGFPYHRLRSDNVFPVDS